MSEIDTSDAVAVNKHNDAILAKCDELQKQIDELKKGLLPAMLRPQASLHDCIQKSKEADKAGKAQKADPPKKPNPPKVESPAGGAV